MVLLVTERSAVMMLSVRKHLKRGEDRRCRLRIGDEVKKEVTHQSGEDTTSLLGQLDEWFGEIMGWRWFILICVKLLKALCLFSSMVLDQYVCVV